MSKCLTLSLVILFVLSFSCTQDGGKNESSSPALEAEQDTTDENTWTEGEEAGFFEDVYYNNLLIIRYSEEAKNKATIRALQNFAAQTAQYHQGLNRQIEQRAGLSDFNPPEKVNDLALEHIREMEEKSGKEFDMAYLEVLSDIQDQMLLQYQKASEAAREQELRNWAEMILSNIKSHQLAVRELREEVE